MPSKPVAASSEGYDPLRAARASLRCRVSGTRDEELAMRNNAWVFVAAAAVALYQGQASGQDRDALSDEVQSYLSVSAPVVALENVLLFDGTGAPRAGRPDHPHPREPHRGRRRVRLRRHPVRCGTAGSGGPLGDARNGWSPRPPVLLPERPAGGADAVLGSAPLPGGRCHDRPDDGQHVTLSGHLAQGRDRKGRDAWSPHRHHGAVCHQSRAGRAAQGPGHVCDPGRGVGTPVRSVLGRGRRRVGQGLHADLGGGAGHDHRRGPQGRG